MRPCALHAVSSCSDLQSCERKGLCKVEIRCFILVCHANVSASAVSYRSQTFPQERLFLGMWWRCMWETGCLQTRVS